MKSLILRLADGTHSKLVNLADQQRRSLNNMINFVLAAYFDVELLKARILELDQPQQDE